MNDVPNDVKSKDTYDYIFWWDEELKISFKKWCVKCYHGYVKDEKFCGSGEFKQICEKHKCGSWVQIVSLQEFTWINVI